MGITERFIKFVKFIKLGHVALLFCFLIPGFVNAQNNSNDIPVTQNGKKFYKHIVSKGETIYGIAEKFKLEPKDIVFENPKAIDGISTGDTLLIPTGIVVKPGDISSPATPDEIKGNYIYHYAIAKETVYSLSKKYNTTVRVIDSLNPGILANGMQIGQGVRIPIAKSISAIQTVPQKQANGTNKEAQAYKALLGIPAPADTSKSLIQYKDTGKKLSRYNIALIMPFASEGVDTLHIGRLIEGTEQIPLTTHISVDFYHGIVMALDSLSKRGFKANLYAFNISSGADSSSRAIDSILRKPEMLKMNLIIGPPYPSNFKKVARFAGLHHISIVSPLSPESSILKNNPFTSKIVPSAATETEVEADYIVSHYRHANIIVVHNRDANDEYYEIFKKRFQKADSAFGGKDTISRAESIGGVSGLGSKLNKFTSNVIVMPYQGAPFVAKFVNELANSKYSYDDSLVLFGMQNWANNDALAADNLDTLNFHFPSNEFVNYTDLPTKKFILQYRNDYLSEPSKYSYEGFDLGMFYGNLLYTYGTNIQNHLGDLKYRGFQTSFDMFRSSPVNGYENRTVYILEYKNYTERLDFK